MRKSLVLLGLLAQHHVAYSGAVVIPKSHEIRVKFDPPFEKDPFCFLEPATKAVIKNSPTRKYVDIRGEPGDHIRYNCTTERQGN